MKLGKDELYKDPTTGVLGIGTVYKDNYSDREWGWCVAGEMNISMEGLKEEKDQEEYRLESVCFALFRVDAKPFKKWKKPKKLKFRFKIAKEYKKKEGMEISVSPFDYPLDWIKDDDFGAAVPHTLCPIAAQIWSGAIVSPTAPQLVKEDQALEYDVQSNYLSIAAELSYHDGANKKDGHYIIGFVIKAEPKEAGLGEKYLMTIVPDSLELAQE